MANAFTLIEILIVIAIGASLAALTMPTSIDFYQSQQFDTAVDEIIQALRRAQIKSMANTNDAAFGVYFEDGQYKISGGADEEIFKVPDNVYFMGLTEIIFSKLDGLPSETGNIIVADNQRIEIININQYGRIQLN